MKITADMEIESVLQFNEKRILETLAWLAPELGRLQYPYPRRSTLGSVTVEQAARIARVPLAEMLYVLNLAAGEDNEELSAELRSNNWVGNAENLPRKSGGQKGTRRTAT